MYGRVRLSLRRLTLLGVVLHAAVLAAAPFEHHDLVCHLKTPQHCSSCTSSPVGASASTEPAPAEGHLVEAGSAVSLEAAPESAILTPRTVGRSPPAYA
jgi:hypothetical protein